MRFAGNGTDVGFWDAPSSYGLTMVDGEDRQFEQVEPAWPTWLLRLEDLKSAVLWGRLSA